MSVTGFHGYTQWRQMDIYMIRLSRDAHGIEPEAEEEKVPKVKPRNSTKGVSASIIDRVKTIIGNGYF